MMARVIHLIIIVRIFHKKYNLNEVKQEPPLSERLNPAL